VPVLFLVFSSFVVFHSILCFSSNSLLETCKVSLLLPTYKLPAGCHAAFCFGFGFVHMTVIVIVTDVVVHVVLFLNVIDNYK
jgi:hypothetical protein